MKDPIITETRKSNLERAFNWIKWDWSSAEITIKGWGDRPQFTIKGKYKGFSFLYRSQSPGGGPSSLKWFDKKGKLHYNYTPAPFIERDKIKSYCDNV